MELSYNPDTRAPAVQGSAGLKSIWEVCIQAAEGALIPARYGRAGLKRILDIFEYRGRILGRMQTKVLRDFLLVIHSHLYSFA
jgi:hypothetical protein